MTNEVDTTTKPDSTAVADEADSARTRWRYHGSIELLAVVVATLVLLSITVRDYGLTLDEPRYIENNHHLLDWFRNIPEIGVSASLQPERLAAGWYYARPDSKNLPLVTIISVMGYAIAGQFDEPLCAWRWGNLIIFALTAGAVYHWVKTSISRPAALVAWAGLLGTPRLLAHANLLAMDTLVGSLWILSAWSLYVSEGRWRRILVFAVLCGVGLIAKPTFWFAVPGFLIWTAVFRRHDLWRVCLALIVVAPLTSTLLAPMWWPNPVSGFFGYVDLLQNDPIGWAIDVYYMGAVYQFDRVSPTAVPWHSVIVLTVITTPVWLLLLCVSGIIGGMHDKSRRPLTSLWLLSAITLPVVCAMPNTPAHDGLRLYRTTFYFLPMLAGCGFDVLLKWLMPHTFAARVAGARHTRQAAVRSAMAVLTVCVLAVWPVWKSHPSGLSYYNFLPGGLQGASSQFEVSYWWDLASPRVLAEMQSNLPQDSRFFTYPHDTGINLMQEWGYVREDITHVVPNRAEYVLIYGRMGRLLGPLGAPDLAGDFLRGYPVWEHRVDDVRVMGLFRLRSRNSARQESP